MRGLAATPAQQDGLATNAKKGSFRSPRRLRRFRYNSPTHSHTHCTPLTHALTRSPKDSPVCMFALLSLTFFEGAQLSNGVIVKATFALCMPDSITTSTRASVAKCRGAWICRNAKLGAEANSGDFFRIRQGGGREMTSEACPMSGRGRKANLKGLLYLRVSRRKMHRAKKPTA